MDANPFQSVSAVAETNLMTDRLPLPPIYSSCAHEVELEPEIAAFVYGLGELVDAFQDAEAAGQLEELETLAVRLFERAARLGFAPLQAAAARIQDACRSRDADVARKAVQELTEFAQRVRRGHRSAAP